MATWKEFGKKLDDAAVDVLYDSGINFKAMGSDEERIDAALSVLHDSPLWNQERYDNLRMMRKDRMYDKRGIDPYSIETASSIIKSWVNKKTDDNKTLTTGDQFFNEYWNADKDKRQYWKVKLERELGKGAWDKIKERMNLRLKREAEAKAARDRVDIIEGRGEGQGVSDWLTSAFGGLFMPRTKQKALAGKEIKASDMIADAAEDVAMMLPFSAATKAGKVLAALAVPAASEAMDAAIYSDSNPQDLAERANFNPVDVGVGTLVNLTAPIAMQRATRGLLNRTFGRGEGGSGMSSDLLEAVTDMSKKGKWEKVDAASLNTVRENYANDLRNKALDPYKEQVGAKTSDQIAEAVDQIIAARDVISSPRANYKVIKAMDDQVDKIIGGDKYLRELYDDMSNYDQETFRMFFPTVAEEYSKKANDAVVKHLEEKAPYTLDELKLLKRADQLVDETKQWDKLFEKQVAGTKKADMVDPNKVKGNFGYNVKIAAGINPEAKDIVRRVLDSDATWLDYQSVAHPKLTEHAIKTGDILNALTANKLGNQRSVDRALMPVESFLNVPGLISKPVKEMQQGAKDEAIENSTKASLVLMADKATDPEDKKWLNELAKNPKLAKGQGEEALNPKFRAWMVLRGTDYLKDTDMFRPTPNVE